MTIAICICKNCKKDIIVQIRKRKQDYVHKGKDILCKECYEKTKESDSKVENCIEISD